MKKYLPLLALASVLPLGGCFSYAEGGPLGGTAWDAGHAEEWCQKYNKHAEITANGVRASNSTQNTVTFRCVTA